MDPFAELVGLDAPLQVLDVGASAINETPIYRALLDQGLAHLNAFEGDPRQVARIREAYGDRATVFDQFLGDGEAHTVHLCAPESGMTSLFRPDPRALSFFNGFEGFGKVEDEALVQTRRLDEVSDLPPIDFIKMDIQGGELTVLRHGLKTLAHCVAVQLEVSFICLYEGQPGFGEVDMFMRGQGFAPHRFVDVKRWSIAPTIFNNDFRVPGNQLLEADIVYVRDPLQPQAMDVDQLRSLAALAHFAFASPDLCVFALRQLATRGAVEASAAQSYLTLLTAK